MPSSFNSLIFSSEMGCLLSSITFTSTSSPNTYLAERALYFTISSSSLYVKMFTKTFSFDIQKLINFL